MHLTQNGYAALLAGTLSPNEARALSAHLYGDCAQCERFLAAQARVDGIDGVTDAAIARAFPAAKGAGNDLEFARISRALDGGRRVSRRRLLSAAVAASIAIAGIGGFLVVGSSRPGELASRDWDGTKGHHARAIPVRLRFLEMGVDGRIEKGISGEQLSASSSLLFQVEASRGACVTLARVSSGGAELLWRSRVSAGRTQVSVGGRPAGYPLAKLTGPQRFVLIASDAPLEDSRAREAAAALAPPSAPSADAPALDGLSLDVVDISVR
jgi:hypothetical protein